MSFSMEIRTSTEQRTTGSGTSTINRESVVYEDLQKWRVQATIELRDEEWRSSRPTKLHKVRNGINDCRTC